MRWRQGLAFFTRIYLVLHQPDQHNQPHGAANQPLTIIIKTFLDKLDVYRYIMCIRDLDPAVRSKQYTACMRYYYSCTYSSLSTDMNMDMNRARTRVRFLPKQAQPVACLPKSTYARVCVGGCANRSDQHLQKSISICIQLRTDS